MKKKTQFSIQSAYGRALKQQKDLQIAKVALEVELSEINKSIKANELLISELVKSE